jgi:hypothetical protein
MLKSNQMKKTLLFALALASICILPSCKKDPAQAKVVFGNNKGMSVTPYDSSQLLVVQYSHTSWGYTIDINNDGKADIQFHSEITGSPAVGHDIVTKLNCLNENVALLGDIINQQRFLHIDTTYYTEDSIHWDIGIDHIITCNQIDETDSIVSTNEKFSLYANNTSQSFDSGNSFMSTNITLKNRPYYYLISEETVGNIVYHHMHDEKDDCDAFPMDEEKYIGFKITENDKSRLGWMRVILHHDYVELLETAIQK